MIFEIKNLSYSYGKKEVLHNLNLKFTPGVYGLLGPNGAGKSTFMKLICMLLTPAQGEICFKGENIQNQKQHFLKKLGYMPQHSCLYPEFGVLEYLYYIGSLKGMEKVRVYKSAKEILEKVRLTEQKNQKIKTLSGGMQQRLMLAQALLDQPEVVILDEPTAGLDPQKRIEMRNLIAEQAKDRVILIATHVVSDVELIADRILLLNQGKLLVEDSVQGLTERLYGTVHEVEVNCSMEELKKRYQVSSMYRKNGKIYAKIIGNIQDGKQICGKPAEPDLEDVYLYYFNEKGIRRGI